MADESKPDFRAMLGRFKVPPFVTDAKMRNQRFGLPKSDIEQGDYIIELNLAYEKGMKLAGIAFRELYARVLGNDSRQRQPQFISKSYFKCFISAKEVRALLEDDERNAPYLRVIYKVWPDFPVEALIDRSVSTVKADAAIRAYEATGEGVVWAVIDSGIDGKHVHFGSGSDGKGPNTFCRTLFDPSVSKLHRDFTVPGGVPQPENFEDSPADYDAALAANVKSALCDEYGHGTHVAGIIAGGLSETLDSKVFHVNERVFKSDPNGQGHTITIEPRRTIAKQIRGVAPQCKLVSLKVLNKAGKGAASAIMLALRYIREELNDDPKMLRVHGVNLSVGYEFDAEMFACGQSPLCVEVNRLVKTGVVVVVAAGNTGYSQISTMERYTKVGLQNTINDPGNAELAITVGSTHRDSPHTYGVSFFSSKGPTGDGRLKPDLVAPGERITSAATRGQLLRLGLPQPVDDGCTYIDDSGTSMAAPHVSGAIAAFLSIRREFIQKPDQIKQIFLENATPLGNRDRYFQGKGIVDLMRAIQSV
ncbi:S8 family peptidase [Tunturiibacter gelidoferens]|uniref:Subtilisin family serine protease n=1 Tax=Tunturiibacter gelidiferens TaxID=3069689 RepID=A0ACC5P3M0_9BACT|nr:S8 family peptidase [Edaphobacter lichenicola]MBB5341461.1 subtilisin family serine protease [Edaphobacter lichenicola]